MDSKRFILTMSHVIKVLGKFHVLDNTIPQKTEQIQTAFYDHILYQYQKNSMFAIGLITNLMICEKKNISYVGQFPKKLRCY